MNPFLLIKIKRNNFIAQLFPKRYDATSSSNFTITFQNWQWIVETYVIQMDSVNLFNNVCNTSSHLMRIPPGISIHSVICNPPTMFTCKQFLTFSIADETFESSKLTTMDKDEHGISGELKPKGKFLFNYLAR